MMYNPQLETFLCVVEAGSFSKAAEKLYISPPAVIKQIIRWRAAWDYSCLTGATGDCK
ncbi:helix-turn-helix domain-containing protein [Blautia faecicola]|uniref:helix-turn-helix domain-containing protein n=1 Tax=Blautia faecicola TaxID=2509240 RepID=UPI003FD870D3